MTATIKWKFKPGDFICRDEDIGLVLETTTKRYDYFDYDDFVYRPIYVCYWVSGGGITAYSQGFIEAEFRGINVNV